MTIVRRSIWAILALAVCLSMSGVAPASAAETLTAAQACPAYQSISKKTNPGAVRLSVGQAYQVVAHNKEPPTWLQVRIAGAQPKDRWVAVACAKGGQAPSPTGPASPPQHAGDATHLLALSWQPTFCRTHASKTECGHETTQSPEARQLSLHGLWPQPIGYYYCIADAAQKASLIQLDKDGRWSQMPDPGLSGATHDRLAVVMPGVQSYLERHEWYKHGTCYGGPVDDYFNRAADLVEQINASAVGRLLSANLGRSVTTGQILAAFDTAFGPGASDAVVVKCDGGGISEIDVFLAGPVAGASPIGPLLHKAPTGSSCASGSLPQPH